METLGFIRVHLLQLLLKTKLPHQKVIRRTDEPLMAERKHGGRSSSMNLDANLGDEVTRWSGERMLGKNYQTESMLEVGVEIIKAGQVSDESLQREEYELFDFFLNKEVYTTPCNGKDCLECGETVEVNLSDEYTKPIDGENTSKDVSQGVDVFEEHDAFLTTSNCNRDHLDVLASFCDWEMIYELICSDYEAQLVHTNGGGDVLTQEDGEGSGNGGQIFDRSLILNGTILPIVTPFLVAERCKLDQEIYLVDEFGLFELLNIVPLPKPWYDITPLQLSMKQCLDILHNVSIFSKDIMKCVLFEGFEDTMLIDKFITALKMSFGGIEKKLYFGVTFIRDMVTIIYDKLASGIDTCFMPPTWQMFERNSSSFGIGDYFMHSHLQKLQGFNLTVRVVNSCFDCRHYSFNRPGLVFMLEVTEDIVCLYKKLSDFSSWLRGSYVSQEVKVFFENDTYLFQITVKENREFVKNLVWFTCKFQREVKIPQNFFGCLCLVAELIIGTFDGLTALTVYYRGQSAFVVVFLFTSSIAKDMRTLMGRNCANTFYGQRYMQDFTGGELLILLPILGGDSGDLRGTTFMIKLFVVPSTSLSLWFALHHTYVVPWYLRLTIGLSLEIIKSDQFAYLTFYMLLALGVDALALSSGLKSLEIEIIILQDGFARQRGETSGILVIVAQRMVFATSDNIRKVGRNLSLLDRLEIDLNGISLIFISSIALHFFSDDFLKENSVAAPCRPINVIILARVFNHFKSASFGKLLLLGSVTHVAIYTITYLFGEQEEINKTILGVVSVLDLTSSFILSWLGASKKVELISTQQLQEFKNVEVLFTFTESYNNITSVIVLELDKTSTKRNIHIFDPRGGSSNGLKSKGASVVFMNKVSGLVQFVYHYYGYLPTLRTRS